MRDQSQTNKQVYIFICAYMDTHPMPPTLKEIADGVGKSKPTVHRAIVFLEAQGKVTRQPGKVRTVLPLR
jgi:SOS-response transcriptional repressor LexA